MRLNLKTVKSLFMRGVRIGQGMPAAVARLDLHVVDGCKYTRVASITRDDFIDCTPRQFKRKIIAMREQGDKINADRGEWMIEAACHGAAYSRKLSVE